MSGVLDKPALSVDDVAKLTGWSRDTVIRVFQNEKGVLILSRARVERMHSSKRQYRTITIPRFVYERVIGRHSVK